MTVLSQTSGGSSHPEGQNPLAGHQAAEDFWPIGVDSEADRFEAKDADDLKTELFILKEDEVLSYVCQLAEISVTGCSLRVSGVAVGEFPVAVLKIFDANDRINLEISGRLCLQQQKSIQQNAFGFRFRRPIDATVIEGMVAAGWVTRRQEPRIDCGSPILIRRAQGLPAVQKASVKDFSATGIRLHVDQPLQPCERLLISTQSGASGSVSVKWMKRTETGFDTGCVFQNLNSARSIHDGLSPA